MPSAACQYAAAPHDAHFGAPSPNPRAYSVDCSRVMQDDPVFVRLWIGGGVERGSSPLPVFPSLTQIHHCGVDTLNVGAAKLGHCAVDLITQHVEHLSDAFFAVGR